MADTHDPRIAAAIRGLGVFLQDYAVEAAEYCAAAMADAPLASPGAAAQQRPVASAAPVLGPDARVDIEAWWPSSPDAVWFRGVEIPAAGGGQYSFRWRKEGKADTGVDGVVVWADDRFTVGNWRPTGNVPRGAPYRIAVHLAEPAK